MVLKRFSTIFKIGCLLFIFCAASFKTQAQTSAIEWQTDYTKALALARKTGKPLLIDFRADWCAPCREMDKSFWTRADVIETVKNFVPLQVDYDKEPKLNGFFNVRGLPYIAFADFYGSLITFQRGYGSYTFEKFKRNAESLPKNFGEIEKDFAAIEKNPSNPPPLVNIADFYRKNQMPVAAARFYQRALNTSEIKNTTEKRAALTAELGRQYVEAADLYQAAFAFQDYLKLFPNGTEKETIYADLIDVYLKTSRFSDAEKMLERYKTDFPKAAKINEYETLIKMSKGLNQKPARP